ncbi:MAG: M56 family metallopeptidase [Eubacteriales bacterium]|nr:M56 family metallopeptidase [Eubacteriales bacterium]
MVWIRLFLFCLITVGLTGTTAYAAVQIFHRVYGKMNPFLFLAWQKVVMVLYCAPILFGILCLSRLEYANNEWRMAGSFLTDTSLFINKFCLGIGAVWLTGVITGIGNMAVKQYKLACIWRGNVDVEDPEWISLIEEYKLKFALPGVKVFQNDLLVSPVTSGCLNPKIVLPYENYTEKQLRMVLEHEMNHIKSHDLFWRKVGVLAVWIQWYNPLTYFLSKQLVYQEEVVCDLKSSRNNPYFTQKEYGYFLAGLADNNFSNMSSIALCESEKAVIRRIETMAKMGNVSRPTKWKVALSCLGLIAMSLIPAGTASAQAVKAQEDEIKVAEAVVDKENTANVEDSGEILQGIADPDVEEIDLTGGPAARSKSVILDGTIKANTRMVYGYHNMVVGDSITISANCSDSSITYRIGIKNRTTNTIYYVEGTGNLDGKFSIPEDGSYTAFVENMTGSSMNITGTAHYVY